MDHEEKPTSMLTADVHWRGVAIGYGVSVGGTLLLGGLLLLWDRNVWWMAIGGGAALLIGGFIAGLRATQPEPLNGAFLAALYFVTVVMALFVGTALEALPDPLPGLPIGDSTFFFVWPLTQLAAAVAGSLLGGWWAAGRAGRGGPPRKLRLRGAPQGPRLGARARARRLRRQPPAMPE